MRQGFFSRLKQVVFQLSSAEEFNQSFKGVSAWPCSLESLGFGNKFNKSLQGIEWPKNLKSLRFGVSFNESLEGVALPSSLESLTFGHDFNQSLDSVEMPKSLATLSFGAKFNRKLTVLPSKLKTLSFGREFNQSLEGVIWPETLQELSFSDHFNQCLAVGDLPNSLQSLAFGLHFNQPLQLPCGVETLILGSDFEHLEGLKSAANLKSLSIQKGSLDGFTLPEGLQSLSLGYRVTGLPLWPKNLRRLSGAGSLPGEMPPGLKELSFDEHCNGMGLLEGLGRLEHLKTLRFGMCFNQTLAAATLPMSLEHLCFGDHFNQSLKGTQLPSSLKTLSFLVLLNIFSWWCKHLQKSTEKNIYPWP